MIYLVKATLDRAAFNKCPNPQEVLTAEGKRGQEIKAEGRVLGIWRRADCGGSVFVVDAESHEALVADLNSLPMFPYMREIEVTPLVAHAAHPEFASARPRA